MSDAQIVAYYSQQKNEKSCGQFREGQLEHINQGLSLPIRKEARKWFKPVLASALLASFGCETQSQTKPPKTEIITEHNELGDPDKIGKVCIDTTIRETGEVETSFEPRKFTHVKSLDSTTEVSKDLKPVIINHDLIEDRDYPVLGGVPAINYEDTERGEVYFKGDINLTSDTVATKTKWHERIFKKK